MNAFLIIISKSVITMTLNIIMKAFLYYYYYYYNVL
jgi:hypothetical protein